MKGFDCKILTMPQKSEAWFEERKGKLTASQIGAWLTDKGQSKRTLDARMKAASKLLAQLKGETEPSTIPNFEVGDPPPESAYLWPIWNGVQREPEARELFVSMNSIDVEEVGFCRHASGIAGCSPDGLIDGGEGLEIKCPILSTFLDYREEKSLPQKYKEQVHFSMAVTGAVGWWFFAYYPNEKPIQIYVERDDYTERMVEGIERFKEYFEKRKQSDEETNKAFALMMGV